MLGSPTSTAITSNFSGALSGTKRKQPTFGFLQAEGLLNAPPQKPPRNSIYARFKRLLLDDKRQKGEQLCDAADYTKAAYAKVRTLVSPPTDAEKELYGDEIEYLYKINVWAQEEENREICENEAACASQAIDFVRNLKTVCNDLQDASFEELEKTIIYINTLVEVWSETYPLPDDYKPFLLQVNERYNKEKIEKVDKRLVDSLRDADDSTLYNHAASYRQLKDEIKDLKYDLERLKLLEAAQRREQDIVEAKARKELSKAKLIPAEIGKALHSQMTYDVSLKQKAKTITYIRGGVSPVVFSEAFEVSVGTRKHITSACSLNLISKPLPYGASLECGEVTITLKGDRLKATTKYKMVVGRNRQACVGLWNLC